MSQRQNEMKWIWCLLVFYSGQAWSPVKGVALPNAPKTPSTIEAQAKFFQDFFSVQLSPYKIEFGHVCEDPNTWEQRYEKKDYKNHRDMGKVRWGDKKGGYGEHYWDLNHAGHTDDNNDHDDHNNGDYDFNDHYEQDSYDEPSEQSSNYQNKDKQTYDENERTKRANYEKTRKDIEDQGNLHENYEASRIQERRPQTKPREKNHIVLVVNQREREPNRMKDVRQFVPYETGSGVRRHQGIESSAVASAPRLYFESSTGHVVDRTTGQAYVLQPVIINH